MKSPILQIKPSKKSLAHQMAFFQIFLILALYLGHLSTESTLLAQSNRALQSPSREDISVFCLKYEAKFKEYKWQSPQCDTIPWLSSRKSEGGYPLVYLVIGDTTHDADVETTLFLGGVHPDELTPISFVQRFLSEMYQKGAELKAEKKRIVIAPLVNPDGFFRKFPVRVNLSGVDLNRNLPTQDWFTSAHLQWKKNKKNPRQNPGTRPASEAGSLFQMELLDEYKPDKIISIHSPLGFLDYDGPGASKTKNVTELEKKAKELALAMSKATKNFSIKDFTYFPGSLGNYAGNDKKIPTLTFELKSSRPNLSDKFWLDLSPGLFQAVHYQFRNQTLGQLTPSESKGSQ